MHGAMGLSDTGRASPRKILIVFGLLVISYFVATSLYSTVQISESFHITPVPDDQGLALNDATDDSNGSQQPEPSTTDPAKDLSQSATSILPSHASNSATDIEEAVDAFPSVWDVDGWPIEGEAATQMRRDRRFVIIVPATSPGANLCKMTMSAIALGYPAPIIVGWGMDHRKITKWNGGPNLIKIPAVLDYLDAALRSDAHRSERLEPDDIVLVADGYDVWFQLPPRIMLQRYHDINAQANARLREQWQGLDSMPMRQTIVAGSEKNCWPRPKYGTNIQCPSLPDSPIRQDLYGPETDKNQTDRHNLRPRYINGGIYIGPAGDMQRWFRRANGILTEGIAQNKKLRSEQGITGQVFGEQEVWRQWRRANSKTKFEQLVSPLMERDFEYHIGLDYFQSITVQTQNSGDDGRFVRFDNIADIEKHSKSLGIHPTRLRALPADIDVATSPLQDLPGQPITWNNMSLYADFYTESVPVILHHNGKGPGQRERREGWWKQPWFFPYLRKLVNRQLKARVQDDSPLATIETTEDGQFTYRVLDAEKRGRKPRIMKGSLSKQLEAATFDEICGVPGEPWWEEIFRDGDQL